MLRERERERARARLKIQAGAELSQAPVNLEVIVEVVVEVSW